MAEVDGISLRLLGAAFALAGMAPRRYERVAFAGNGSPDYQAALVVPPELRFARGWLARRFDHESIPYRPFEAWGEVAGALLAPASHVTAG